jgi:hypothetical protein
VAEERREARVAKELSPPNSLPDFEKLPWHDLYPRLLLAALFKIRGMVWRGEFRGHVPGGSLAQDAVQTAVLKFLAGERRWNTDKSDYDNLWGAVSGVIINWGTSAENRTTSRSEDNKVVQLRDPQPGPDIYVEWRSERDQLLQYLCARDVEAAWMAQLMLDHDLNGPELADTMARSQQKTDNIKKRLRRLIKDYLADCNQDDPRATE